MASLTIRNIEDQLKGKLRVRAAERGHSMEEEARLILRGALADKPAAPVSFYVAIRRHIAPLGGIDLEIPARQPMRDPPSFD